MANETVGVMVTVTIPDDKKDEFLKVMAIDVEGSRKEAGCLRFDLLEGGNGVYHFYEVYKDSAAMTLHKEQDHYKAWASFKAANQSVADSQTVVKFKSLDPC